MYYWAVVNIFFTWWVSLRWKWSSNRPAKKEFGLIFYFENKWISWSSCKFRVIHWLKHSKNGQYHLVTFYHVPIQPAGLNNYWFQVHNFIDGQSQSFFKTFQMSYSTITLSFAVETPWDQWDLHRVGFGFRNKKIWTAWGIQEQVSNQSATLSLRPRSCHRHPEAARLAIQPDHQHVNREKRLVFLLGKGKGKSVCVNRLWQAILFTGWSDG